MDVPDAAGLAVHHFEVIGVSAAQSDVMCTAGFTGQIPETVCNRAMLNQGLPLAFHESNANLRSGSVSR